MTIDAAFWVAISFFIFLGVLVYFKIPLKSFPLEQWTAHAGGHFLFLSDKIIFFLSVYGVVSQ